MSGDELGPICVKCNPSLWMTFDLADFGTRDAVELPLSSVKHVTSRDNVDHPIIELGLDES